MKINKFEVECELSVSASGVITGWFKLPSAPHARYTIELDADSLFDVMVDEEYPQNEEVEETPVSGAPVEDINIPNENTIPQQPPTPEPPVSA